MIYKIILWDFENIGDILIDSDIEVTAEDVIKELQHIKDVYYEDIYFEKFGDKVTELNRELYKKESSRYKQGKVGSLKGFLITHPNAIHWLRFKYTIVPYTKKVIIDLTNRED